MRFDGAGGAALDGRTKSSDVSIAREGDMVLARVGNAEKMEECYNRC